MASWICFPVAILHIVLRTRPASVNDLIDQPALSQIIGVDNAASPQFDTLATPIDPRKINVKSGLNDSEYYRNGVGKVIFDTSNNPIHDVESTIGAQSKEVEGVDDSGYGRLTQKEELRKNAEGF